MDYFLHVFYGVLMAYIGLISPGMLNMTALKISLSTNKKESIKFALGASLVVFFQAGIALFFADYFVKNPKIIEVLKVIGVFVFFILSVLFFILSRKVLNAKTTKGARNYFLKGIAMSVVNMLAVPFYLGISIYLASINKIIIEQPFIILFVFGSALGSYLLFYTYIILADVINNKIAFIAKNINLILSILFLILGILTLFKLLR
ncbi:LysE family transporter [Lutibacter aestuarii]|uniref:LysE family transporter n=1 Tax=Lutibacter aestuarii TaxID=861111 RepID=A0ABW2Z8L1_9FLAO